MGKISVLGAGIIGISCAVQIKEFYPESEVVIISEKFSPNTTGDGSGGLWYPYLCGNTPGSQLNKWGSETFKFLHKCWLAGNYRVSLMPIFVLGREPMNTAKLPVWAGSVFEYQQLQSTQLEHLSRLYSEIYTSGHTFNTFVTHTSAMLSHLYDRFKKAGGTVMRHRVTSLRDPVLAPFDVVINCCGLGSKEIVPDEGLFSIRGQVLRVKAPWINEVLIDEASGHYIIPNAETCVLGGTHQENDYNTKVDAKDTEFILTGCYSRIPSLKGAPIVNQWAGLRPGREQVRLEAEDRDGKLIIHNYGHGLIRENKTAIIL